MLVITIYKMSNASRCYPVAKSHQDHKGSNYEPLSSATSARMWFDWRGRDNAFS